jgi:minor histocompatibility antigen H13
LDCTQAGQLGERSIPLAVPDGWFMDEEGNSMTRLSLAPTDIAAVLLGIGVASVDLACNHSSFTLNNMLACLIAADILQVDGLTMVLHRPVLRVTMKYHKESMASL